MKKFALIILMSGIFQSVFGQNLLTVDGLTLRLADQIEVHVEGSVILQNQGAIYNNGTLYVGSSGSGYVPSEASYINNNSTSPGHHLLSTGAVRLLRDGARITGTFSGPSVSFNDLYLDAANGQYWQDVPVQVFGRLFLGNNNSWHTNNQFLHIDNEAANAIDSGTGGIVLESGPPLPGAGQWSEIRRELLISPAIYSLPLRDEAGNDFQFVFSTLPGNFATRDLRLSTYHTGQDNLPLPESYYSVPAPVDSDIDNDGSDDGNSMVDRYWLVSTNRSLNTVEFHLPSSEASTGGLTPTTPLQVFGFETDWSINGGSGDAQTGVSINLGGPVEHIFALAGDPVVLPVECVSFTGMQEGHNVRLAWQTATETNNAGFEIQRSTDGINFDQIAFAEGHGTSTNPLTYNYTDETAFPGRAYYYRLLQHDFNGNTQFACDIIHIETEGYLGDSQLAIAPNPATTYTHVLLPEMPVNSTIQLTTPDGRLVKELPVTSQKTRIQRNGLPSGVYFIKIKDETDNRFSNPVKLIFVD